MGKKIFIFVWELLKVTVISLAIIIPIRYYLIQPFYVRGASMEPNFHNHEYLIIEELSFRFREPIRGEVVVFRYPRNPQEFFIKRIIALPGESIQIKDGRVIIYNNEHTDGWLLNEPYLAPEVFTHSADENKITLKSDEYYILGDNRQASMDSRSFGPLNQQFIIGRAFFRGWPFSRMTFFDNLPNYNFFSNNQALSN